MMNAKKKSVNRRMLDTAHDMAQGLYDAGIIDATTMRDYEAWCLSTMTKRPLGLAKGQVKIADDFDASLPDKLMALFDGTMQDQTTVMKR